MTRIRDGENPVEHAVWERCDLALAQILGVKDRIKYLTPDDAGRLRGVVLRELNEFADLCVSLIRASSDGAQVNEEYLRLLSEIHSAIVPSG